MIEEIILQVNDKEVILPNRLSISQYQRLKMVNNIQSDPIKFLCAITNLGENEIRGAKKSDIDFIMTYLSNHYMNPSKNDIKPSFEFGGVEYGLHTDLKTLNYGGWVDLEFLITEGVEKNIHKIMSIFYRPITGWNKKRTKYYLDEYDHDKMQEQSEIFLNIPIEYWFSCSGFFFQVAKISTDNMRDFSKYQQTRKKAIMRLRRIFPKWIHSKLFPDFTGPV